jgi:hypothetical protein
VGLWLVERDRPSPYLQPYLLYMQAVGHQSQADMRVLRLDVSVYNVYVTNQFQTTFQGGGGEIR